MPPIVLNNGRMKNLILPAERSRQRAVFRSHHHILS